MIFKVFNECGDEDEVELKFTLPAICQQVIIDPVPDTPKFVVEGISPNPSTSFITIKYSPKENGQLKVFGSNLNTLNQYGFIRNSAETVGDNQQFTLDITNWQTGINSLIFEFNGELNVETVKLDHESNIILDVISCLCVCTTNSLLGNKILL